MFFNEEVRVWCMISCVPCRKSSFAAGLACPKWEVAVMSGYTSTSPQSTHSRWLVFRPHLSLCYLSWRCNLKSPFSQDCQNHKLIILSICGMAWYDFCCPVQKRSVLRLGRLKRGTLLTVICTPLMSKKN